MSCSVAVAEKSQFTYPWPTFSWSLHSSFTLFAHGKATGGPASPVPRQNTTFCLYLDQNQKFPNVPYVTNANSECAGSWTNFFRTWFQHIHTVLLYRLWGPNQTPIKGVQGTLSRLSKSWAIPPPPPPTSVCLPGVHTNNFCLYLQFLAVS